MARIIVVRTHYSILSYICLPKIRNRIYAPPPNIIHQTNNFFKMLLNLFTSFCDECIVNYFII